MGQFLEDLRQLATSQEVPTLNPEDWHGSRLPWSEVQHQGRLTSVGQPQFVHSLKTDWHGSRTSWSEVLHQDVLTSVGQSFGPDVALDPQPDLSMTWSPKQVFDPTVVPNRKTDHDKVRQTFPKFPAWLQKSGRGPMPRKNEYETALVSAGFRCSLMGECDY